MPTPLWMFSLYPGELNSVRLRPGLKPSTCFHQLGPDLYAQPLREQELSISWSLDQIKPLMKDLERAQRGKKRIWDLKTKEMARIVWGPFHAMLRVHLEAALAAHTEPHDVTVLNWRLPASFCINDKGGQTWGIFGLWIGLQADLDPRLLRPVETPLPFNWSGYTGMPSGSVTRT